MFVRNALVRDTRCNGTLLRNTTLRNTTAALAAALVLGFAGIAPAAPARPVHPGHAAHAQAIGTAPDGISRHRADALRAGNDLANRYSQPTYGNMQSDTYRSCMMQHGESE
jgi:hypothetical protein